MLTKSENNQLITTEMKTLLRATLILALLACSNISQSQVFVDGIVYAYSDDSQPVQVTVMEDDQFYKSIKTSKAGKFRVRLQPNHFYVINMSKPDHYITKIAVDTHVPFEPGPDFYTEIPLEADLVREYIDMDPAVMKKPLSIFSYDATSETFIQDDEYLQKARAQLEAFLYEVEEAKKRANEELADNTPKKSLEETDSLQAKIKEEQIALLNKAVKSSKNLPEEDTALTVSDPNKQQSEAIAFYDTKSEVGLSNANSGPSAPVVLPQVQEVQDSLYTDTISDDSLKKELRADSMEDYSISIRINDRIYNPDSDTSMKVIEDLDIEIIGIPSDGFNSIQYKLEGKDSDFSPLKDDELEYNDIKEGNYTFVLSSNNNDFDDIRVPLIVEKEGSDFPWIFIILGIIVIVLIIIFNRRRKTERTDYKS